MPVEQCCFQMRKSYSKGWGNTCWTRQRGCFQQGMAAKGLFTSRGGSWGGARLSLETGNRELGASLILHPLVQPAKDSRAGHGVPLQPEQSTDQAPAPLAPLQGGTWLSLLFRTLHLQK